jgi:hypothetical protein
MIVMMKRSFSPQDLTGYEFPAEFAAARHGGRTDVTTERPDLVAGDLTKPMAGQRVTFS